jgi:hypothetical protein
MKTAELADAALDYWVAKALGPEYNYAYVEHTFRHDGVLTYVHPAISVDGNAEVFEPSLNWAQAGPIIERDAITITPISDAEWQAEEHITHCRARGITYLQAAMRCKVASVYGEEVPDEA